MKRFLSVVGLVGLTGGAALAQGLGNAPYSQTGLGEYNPNVGGVRQMGMGGVGLAASNAINVNELNPALLCFTSRTTFEAGYNGQYSTVRNATARSRSGSGTLGYFALAVPLGSKWGAAVGLKPLSSVDYETNNVRPVVNGPAGDLFLEQKQGTGGVSEAYFGQGLLLGKSLSVGATVSYLFGTVDQTRSSTLLLVNDPTTDLTRTVDRTHLNYSDFSFRAGLHYRHKLGEALSGNVAGVYSFQSDLAGRRTRTEERQDLNGALKGPALLVADERGQVLQPALAQVGLSLDNNKNFSVNLDVAQQRWSQFSSFGAAGDLAGQPLRDTWRGGLGGELTPDPTSVDHYLRRVSYRAGISVAQLPYQPGGQTLYDRSVSWGFAFPIPAQSALDATTFSLAFTYGRRGNTEAVNTAGGPVSNVQENYLKGTFGVTLNNRWFIKRRLQ